MSRIEQGKNINQQPIQPKTEGAAKTVKSAEKADFNLLSKFREFRQRATLLGFLTLAGIMGSCGDNPLTDSSIVETQDNVKKTPSLKPNFGANTLGEIKKIPESERQKETYNVTDFIVDELLLNQFKPEKEKERIKKSLLIHSTGTMIIYPIGASIPFVDGLKRQIEQENLIQQTKMTQQQKTDELIQRIVAAEKKGDNDYYASGGGPYHIAIKRSTLQFIIMKQPRDTDRRDLIKIDEGFIFQLCWQKGPDMLAEDEEVLKLYQTDTRNSYVAGATHCEWFLYKPDVYAPGNDEREWSSITEPDAKLDYDQNGKAYSWSTYSYVMSPGSNSPHMAFDNKNQDIVWTDNLNILGKISVKNFSWPRPRFIIMELLDTPIPVE